MALEHWLARGLDLTAACIDGVGTVVRSAKGLAGKAQKNGLVERGRFVPESPLATEPDSESLDAWGFKDTAFTLNSAGNVVLGGDRYDLCGQELPNLIPWMEDVLQLSIERKEIHESSYPTLVPDSRAGKGVVAILKSVFPGGSLTTDPLLRLRHGHGHTQSEMFAIKYGKIGRIPDVVVFPKVES
ncbi:MAG: hypothetical protein VYA34_02290, partial [Myxococcota bacterium]|nr:hypothetical protein [Myxococcota bacterium]